MRLFTVTALSFGAFLMMSSTSDLSAKALQGDSLRLGASTQGVAPSATYVVPNRPSRSGELFGNSIIVIPNTQPHLHTPTGMHPWLND